MADTKTADAAAAQAEKDANVAKEKSAVATEMAATAHVEEVKREDVQNDKIAHEHAEEIVKEREKI